VPRSRARSRRCQPTPAALPDPATVAAGTRAGAGVPTLDRRTLNRTLLSRQLLLERVHRPPASVIEHLVGLQAQEPGDPYVALWTRIEGFDPLELSTLISERAAVRVGLMRTTLHLVTARDCLTMYPLIRDVLVRTFRTTPFAKSLDGVDLDPIVAAARAFLEERPHTPSELGARLAASWPDRDPAALAYAARYLLPLVQVPPRGLWGATGRATNTTAEAWLGTAMAADASLDDLVLRYLAAFGPATVADIRTWSWLTGLRAVIERLRGRLRMYRDEGGRELFDVPDGSIADPETPAPIRFLPQYDNVFLSHEDRSRILGSGLTIPELTWRGGVLIDGFVSAAWRIRREKRAATMTITLTGSLGRTQRSDLEAEAATFFPFVAADADTRDLRIVEAGT